MKNIIFLILMFSSFLAVACENEIEGIAGSATDGANSNNRSVFSGKDDKGGTGQIECIIELPPIQAVITYITFAPNWLGGVVGIGYALNITGTGGGIGIVAGVNMSNLDGCDSTSTPQRQADAKKIYLAMKQKMTQLLVTADDPSPQLTSAERWLNIYGEGSIFKVTYPDGTKGFFRVDLVGSFGLTETACG